MSSDAIIEGLKQGNAMEMATIEEVKAGMTSVLDGMLRECFKRSDGLTELTEKLQLEHSSAKATNLTEAQTLQIWCVIKGAISSCEQAMIINDRKEEKEIEQAKTAFEAERKTRNVIVDHLNAEVEIYNERRKITDTIPENSNMFGSLVKLHWEETKLLYKLRDTHTELREDARARKASRLQEIKETYEKEQNEFKKQIANLELIARLAEIDIKATSLGEALGHVYVQEP